MRIERIVWLGTRTERATETANFFQQVLGMKLETSDADFWMLALPGGGRVEVFGPGCPHNRHFTTGPVAGFLVDDLSSATSELRRAGVELVFGPKESSNGYMWLHFIAPDGRIYELTQNPAAWRASRTML